MWNLKKLQVKSNKVSIDFFIALSLGLKQKACQK
jgi:hypothetical protein